MTLPQPLMLEPCQRLGFSQSNQDCIIDKIFKAIGTTNKYYVEYGFNTNEQCSGTGPSTCLLWKSGNWKGLLLDGSHTNEAINLRAHYLYSNNMVAILEKYNVPKELDFYSGDMDSHDYFVMKSVLDSGKFRPRLISTEYNPNYPIDWEISQMDPTISKPDQEPPPYTFQGCVHGGSASAFRFLMEKHGYELVAVVNHLDLFWIRKDILEKYNYKPSGTFEELMAGKTKYSQHPIKTDGMFLSNLVDIRVYEETQNYRQANRAIVQTILDHIKSTTEPTIACLGAIKVEQVEEYLANHPPIGEHLNLS